MKEEAIILENQYKYKDVPRKDRPYLRKVYLNKSVKEYINIANKLIYTLFTAQPTMDELQNVL